MISKLKPSKILRTTSGLWTINRKTCVCFLLFHNMNDQCWWHDAVSNDPVPRTLSWPSLWILWPGVPRVMTMPCCDREQGTSHNMGSSINDTYIGYIGDQHYSSYSLHVHRSLFVAVELNHEQHICIAERHHLWRFLVISMHTSHVTCYREHWPVINVISVTLLVHYS